MVDPAPGTLGDRLRRSEPEAGPAVEVTPPIEEGTIIVLRNVEFGEPEVMGDVVEQMGYVAGHDRFLVLCVAGDGEVETWGPDTDVKARIDALLAESRRPTPPPRPGSPAGWQGGDGRRPVPAARP